MANDVYKAVSNYIQNELGIGAKEINDIIERVLESKIETVVKHYFCNRNMDETVRKRIDQLVNLELSKTNDWFVKGNPAAKLIDLIRDEIGRLLYEKFEVKVNIKAMEDETPEK